MKNSKLDLNKEDSLVLDVLSLIDNDNENKMTQRSIASTLNVAIGVANLYVKRCVEKGLLKINQVPKNRYKYYLTPKGFTEKARLTRQYFESSFKLFRKTRSDFNNIFISMSKKNLSTVILSDVSEIADIIILCAEEHNIKVLGFLNNNTNEKPYRNLIVSDDLKKFPKFDLIIITSFKDSDLRVKQLSKKIKKNKLIIPSIFNFENWRY